MGVRRIHKDLRWEPLDVSLGLSNVGVLKPARNFTNDSELCAL